MTHAATLARNCWSCGRCSSPTMNGWNARACALEADMFHGASATAMGWRRGFSLVDGMPPGSADGCPAWVISDNYAALLRAAGADTVVSTATAGAPAPFVAVTVTDAPPAARKVQPLDLVVVWSDASRRVGLVTTVSPGGRNGGQDQDRISIEWLAAAPGMESEPGEHRTAWWNAAELEVVDSLPSLLARAAATPHVECANPFTVDGRRP